MIRTSTDSEPTDLDVAERWLRERELIRRICAGEKELYFQLICPYERSVFLTALSITRNDADAEDVAQEAFLNAFLALPSFRFESRFSTWLKRIALNQARMRRRRLRLSTTQSINEDEVDSDERVPLMLSDWREVPSEALERKEVRQILRDAMLKLPECYREVLILRDVREFSIVETAELLDLTPSNVKIRLLRARLKLRNLIAPLLRNSNVTSRNPFTKGQNPW